MVKSYTISEITHEKATAYVVKKSELVTGTRNLDLCRGRTNDKAMAKQSLGIVCGQHEFEIA